MPISKDTVIDKIEVSESRIIQVREATWYVEDGVRVGSPTYHRRVIDVDEELPDMTHTSNSDLLNDVATGKVRSTARRSARISENPA